MTEDSVPGQERASMKRSLIALPGCCVHATWDGDDACCVDDGGDKKGRGTHMSYRVDYPSFAGPEGHGQLEYTGLPRVLQRSQFCGACLTKVYAGPRFLFNGC
jgi:hypothetical protein